MSYERRLMVLGRGLAGCSGEGKGSSITYYDSRLRPYFGELLEGGYVVDKREVLEERPGLAVLSPMCDGGLPLGAVDEFKSAEGSLVAQAIASGGEGSFRDLARLALAAPRCGAFDFVAADVYAAWWKDHGARVGRRVGEVIRWDDGSEESIRPFETRYQCDD
jgi:hypothetical protein